MSRNAGSSASSPPDESQRRATRFLDAFRDIEEFLASLAGLDIGAGYERSLKRARKLNAGVRLYEDQLRRFAFLRNAIVHWPTRGGAPIADPRPDAVREIEFIRNAIVNPPLMTTVVGGPVECCGLSDGALDAAALMARADFSQLPVLGDEGVTGLLTTEAVAHWLTSCASDGTLAPDVTVGDIVAWDHDPYYEPLPARATVADALERFQAALRAGRPLRAVVLCEVGTPRPLGIATVWDLPRLFDALQRPPEQHVVPAAGSTPAG
jgi:CBS domain-containing protein